MKTTRNTGDDMPGSLNAQRRRLNQLDGQLEAEDFAAETGD